MKNKILKLSAGFIILISIQFISNCIVEYFDIPFPSPILGMLLLTFTLCFNIIPKRFVSGVSDLLLKNMSLFFVPLFVGIVCYTGLIKQNLVPIILTVFCTTFFAMLATAFLVQYIIKITDKGAVK